MYLLLDEMIEYGIPFNTELNIIEGIIAPPSLANRIVSTIAGTNSQILSDVPPDAKGAQAGGTILFFANAVLSCVFGAVDGRFHKNYAQIGARINIHAFVSCLRHTRTRHFL